MNAAGIPMRVSVTTANGPLTTIEATRPDRRLPKGT
jgi:hypothetical protein